MTLADILRAKGSTVFTIGPEAKLQQAIDELCRRNVGALLVCSRDVSKGEEVLGIVTERDILHTCSEQKSAIESLTVGERMSTDLVIASPDDPVESVMGKMTQNRVRHLPVLSDGKLVGLVSIGDLVKSQIDQLARENQFMKDYIQS